MNILQEYEKLPADFKEKWIKALRSGEYEQSTGFLYNPAQGGYCCLGVACNISGIPKEKLVSVGDIWSLNKILNEDLTGIPDILKEENETGSLVFQLIQMNDTSGMSFGQIADWIEIAL